MFKYKASKRSSSQLPPKKKLKVELEPAAVDAFEFTDSGSDDERMPSFNLNRRTSSNEAISPSLAPGQGQSLDHFSPKVDSSSSLGSQLASPTYAPFAEFRESLSPEARPKLGHGNSSGDRFVRSESHSSTDDSMSEKEVSPSFSHPPPPVQRDTSLDGNYSNMAQKMMANMGYQKGKGLGLRGEGRVDIVESSKQRGRRGLGHVTEGFEASDDLVWEDNEEVSAHETYKWMPPCNPIEEAELAQWRDWKREKRKDYIDDETHFCDPDILRKLLSAKSAFDKLDDPEEMRQARTRSNPFETLRGGIFLNRAAMKMANMDQVFNFMFTSPRDGHERPLVGHNDLLYFADICAGPGGFSEYVLWRRKHRTKGFGFTIKGPNDFKLEEFFAASPEYFEPHYGVNGANGDGDIMSSDNQIEFRKFVFENTDNKGVHFVMGDGGFSVAGQENIQEILSKQLLLCQLLVALSVLRPGGSFVCKTFDLFTPFSIGLMYLLYKAFYRVSLFKPVTSRPANSERYVVCKGMRTGANLIHDYLFDLNKAMNRLKNTGQDILECVPLDVIKADAQFTQYIKDQNESQARSQAQGLAKIQAFVRNTTLIEPKQADMREECLKLWGVPGETRSTPKLPDPMTKFNQLNKDDSIEFFHHPPTVLDRESLGRSIRSIFDYRCMVSGGERLFIIGIGRSHVFQWDGRPGSKWSKLQHCNLRLPGDTLFEAEMMEELRGEGYGQRRMCALHMLDAMWLGGEDVRQLHFTERITKAELFVKAIHKPTKPTLTPLRVKEVFRFEEIHKIFDRLEFKQVKGSGRQQRLCFRTNTERHFIPTGVCLVKTINDPWTMHWSRTNQRKYFYNASTRESRFDCPPDCIASFKACHLNRLQWVWEEGVQIHERQLQYDQEKLSKDDMLDLVNRQRVV
ncbi:cap-specific mRNA (nucleoside-2'-O-)-methyltransferase 1-like [Patiria miniata]|uniref:Cap-specific mRNA (nucleoside-2'-O-)-methyltransferase 1 n=1 Tax=Patiria miniata TaxID=46514 RepID=A0A914BEI6_PATMI|nr:cap-specific mRNA (nucleoside-2'-O-)-methyltransferase 1-like [Patiria miniata]